VIFCRSYNIRVQDRCSVLFFDKQNYQLGAIRKECGKSVEFGESFRKSTASDLVSQIPPSVFVDGPMILEPADVPSTPLDSDGTEDAMSFVPASTPRAWWRFDNQSSKAVGLEKTLEVLRDVLKGENFFVRL
jgi:hypothetical protein